MMWFAGELWLRDRAVMLDMFSLLYRAVRIVAFPPVRKKTVKRAQGVKKCIQTLRTVQEDTEVRSHR